MDWFDAPAVITAPAGGGGAYDDVEFVALRGTGGTASQTQTTPEGAEAGDLAVFLLAHFENITLDFDPLPGFLERQGGEGAINNVRAAAAAGTLPSVPQTVSATVVAHHNHCLVFRGASGVTDAGFTAPGVVSTVTMPAKTVVRPGSRAVFAALFSSGIGGNALTAPAGWTVIPGSHRTSGFPGRCMWLSPPLQSGLTDTHDFVWETAVASACWHAILEPRLK